MEIRKEEEKQKKFCEKLLSELCEIFFRQWMISASIIFKYFMVKLASKCGIHLMTILEPTELSVILICGSLWIITEPNQHNIFVPTFKIKHNNSLS